MSATPRTHNADGARARGTSNGNERGGSDARRARKAWLLETYAANVKLIKVMFTDGTCDYLTPTHAAVLGLIGVEGGLPFFPPGVAAAVPVPTARCYRCGRLLHMDTLTVDRIIPGAHGGRYVRNNIRPACNGCNASTGATVRRKS